MPQHQSMTNHFVSKETTPAPASAKPLDSNATDRSLRLTAVTEQAIEVLAPTRPPSAGWPPLP